MGSEAVGNHGTLGKTCPPHLPLSPSSTPPPPQSKAVLFFFPSQGTCSIFARLLDFIRLLFTTELQSSLDGRAVREMGERILVTLV